METVDWGARIDVEAARDRIAGHVRRTRLVPYTGTGLGGPGREAPPVELRLKLECEQETGSFKARGATNQLAQLSPEERLRGVVATSSGNHGRAVAWAARRAGVKATLYMPANIYPNKLAAAKAEGAEVVLCPTRAEAEERCAEAVRAGANLVHPYNALRTAEGAGTVGLEIVEDWPEVELAVFPCGGGGLLAGSSWAIHRKNGGRTKVVGVEPEGAPNLSRGLEAGEPVLIESTSTVQGLTPPSTGAGNLDLVRRYVESVVTLPDDVIYAAQKELVRDGFVVEPAGAATFAALREGALPAQLFDGRDASNPLRVACVVSGANADPAQIEGLREEIGANR